METKESHYNELVKTLQLWSSISRSGKNIPGFYYQQLLSAQRVEKILQQAIRRPSGRVNKPRIRIQLKLET